MLSHVIPQCRNRSLSWISSSQIKQREREEERMVKKEYCVTGGTGFIAAYLVKSLLEKGHTVRATVRDPEKVVGGFLWELQGAKERLKIYKADLMVEGSFDEAIHGVDGVFHTASPVLVPYDENIQASLIDPCIKGTANVLRSCKKASSSVKRVVLTSSCSAIRYGHHSHGHDHHNTDDDAAAAAATASISLNESHWSDLDYCKTNNLWYAYAKTIAEKDAWRIASENGIDLVVVNPSFVVGPLLAPTPTSTLQLILSILTGQLEEYPNTTIGFVHIDDVIGAHILAMEEPNASGRLICSTSTALHWSQIIQMLKAKYPSYPYTHKCSSKEGDTNPHTMDSTKIHHLGLPSFNTIPQMFDDCIKSFHQKGLLPPPL